MTSNDKTLKLSPWNENNYLITENDIYTIYEKCGFENVRETIKINDLKLYQTAFIHGSYIKKNNLKILINQVKKYLNYRISQMVFLIYLMKIMKIWNF